MPAGMLVCPTKQQPKSLGMANLTASSSGRYVMIYVKYKVGTLTCSTPFILWHVARMRCAQTCFGRKPCSELGLSHAQGSKIPPPLPIQTPWLLLCRLVQERDRALCCEGNTDLWVNQQCFFKKTCRVTG